MTRKQKHSILLINHRSSIMFVSSMLFVIIICQIVYGKIFGYCHQNCCKQVIIFMIYRYSALNVFDWNSYTMVVQSQTKFDDFIFYMKRIETAPNIITSKTTSKCIRHFYSCVKISVIILSIKICFDIENHIFRILKACLLKIVCVCVPS